ncbi:ABC transporter, ATP-binding protein [delta proteobacterium NaphS2]|nr:ABC transporter, ATP-binding protein [delta proteobacterium NaphS2]
MLLRVKNLHKRFGTGRRRKHETPVLKGIGLSLNRGETVGIAGGSGAGKTTLALILCGLLPWDHGEIWLKGAPLDPRSGARSRKSAARVHRCVQIVWQQPETAFNPRWKLGRSLKEPLLVQGVRPAPETLAARLDQVDLKPEVLDRRPRQLSGGELQRLALARALISGPDLVILDEPTSMLDALTQARVIRMLQDIQRKTNVAYLFISHDMDLVRIFSHRAHLLQNGKLKSLSFQGATP